MIFSGCNKKGIMDMHSQRSREQKKKIISIISAVVFILFFVIAFFLVGGPMLQFVSDPESFRLWVSESGITGKIFFVGMMAIQVLIAIIPGEPLELVAGYAFGAIEGTVLCLIGQAIGSLFVYFFVSKVGVLAVEAFFSKEKIESLAFLKNHKRLNLIVFILFFIPGTPKDLMTYVVGLTPMRWWEFFLISLIARTPSVVTSTISGDAIGLKNYDFAIVVFIVTILISGIGLLIYRAISERSKVVHNDKR
jgi:uncharacterized membrane protein YdjX (TVP38/TMEM64 family)